MLNIKKYIRKRLPTAKLRLNCRNCGKIFWRYKIRVRGGFCSRSCWDKYESKMGRRVIRCTICNGPVSKFISRLKRNKRNYCSRKCHSIGTSKFYSGENNPTWEGGKTKESHRIKHSLPFYTWRSNVFKRDNYTCQFCGKRGGKIEAHHIKPFSIFPELRLELNNGVTLCKNCHKKTDSYGYKVLNLDVDVLRDYNLQSKSEGNS